MTATEIASPDDTLRSIAAGPQAVGAIPSLASRFAQEKHRCDRRGWSALPAGIARNGPLIHPGPFAAERRAFRHRSGSPALPPSIRFATVACIAPAVGENGGCRRYRGLAQTAGRRFRVLSESLSAFRRSGNRLSGSR
jgi:hypothetical protein